MTFTSVLEKLTQRLPLTGEDFVFLLTGLTSREEQQLYAAAGIYGTAFFTKISGD